ncbi:MAG: S41 family peptidase [Clostridia bacterium]|nr:S41 family peptidase [Clostridia bacterium]
MKRNGFCRRLLAACLLILMLIPVFSGCLGVRIGSSPATGTEKGEVQSGSLVDLLSEREEIPAFNKTVLKRIHTYYSQLYFGDLGTNEEMVEAIVGFYLEYRDLIDETDSDEVTDLLCECYIAAAGDKYAYYMNPEAYAEYSSDMSGSYVGIGVQVTNDSIARTITVTAVFPDTPANAAGILVGDTIEKVGDVPISELSFAEVVSRIRGEEGTDVTVTFGRNGELYTRTMTRRSVVQVTASATVRTGTPKIGVLRITEFDDTTEAQFKAALDGLLSDGVQGLVFDLRNNPGGYLTAILSILDYLVPKGTPLASIVDKTGETVDEYKSVSDHRISSTLPIAVLCNQYTASAGELFTCALQDYNDAGLLNVTVVGTVTYGKGSMQQLYSLGDGRVTTITVAHYNPPYSDNYEGIGVIPDIEIELSEEAQAKSIYVLTDEEDVQMQAAIASVTERIGQAGQQ